MRIPEGLHVDALGDGPRAVFVHGSMGWGADTFPRQSELSHNGWTVVLVDRRGFGQSPAAGRVDFDRDAVDIAALIDGGAHLVGQSYGAVVSLLAAQVNPGAVTSLTLIEPPLLSLAESDPAVVEWRERLAEAYRSGSLLSPEEFWLAFVRAGGAAVDTAPELTAEDRRAIVATMTERPPWEARVSFDVLAAMACPKVLCLGGRGHLEGAMSLMGRALHAVGRDLAERIDAEVIVFERSAHSPQIEEAEAFNQRLLTTWSSA